MIDQTEAMTTIDVNTGSYVGGRSLEDTVLKLIWRRLKLSRVNLDCVIWGF